MEENPYQPSMTDLDSVDLVPVEIVDPAAPRKPRLWGFWVTIGFSLAIAVLYVLANIVIVIGFMIVYPLVDPSFNMRTAGESLESNGLLLSVGTILSAPVALASIWLAIWARRRITVREYLGLWPVSSRTLLVWLFATCLFLVGEDLFQRATGVMPSPEFMFDAWRTAGVLPLLWITLIIFAPLVEEAFFRGFLFVGLQNSPIGRIGAVLITSVAWAVIHLQYDFSIRASSSPSAFCWARLASSPNRSTSRWPCTP
ncbi:MAG TPA: type II CAAX endopeptidase family protein [Thermoguttaceae bacterium]|nr:type II CAAX endopeptidase family protein [Thermoguttaceae bacterium]